LVAARGFPGHADWSAHGMAAPAASFALFGFAIKPATLHDVAISPLLILLIFGNRLRIIILCECDHYKRADYKGHFKVPLIIIKVALIIFRDI
jgi:hypothetical protein